MTPAEERFGAQMAIARAYGDRTVNALVEMVHIAEAGARLVARGRDWYTSDPANVPGLAAESLIIKLGENVSRVSAVYRADHPEVPWQIIKAMRNRLTHYYEATDHGVIWVTLERDFPAIKGLVTGLLEGPD